MDKEAVVHTSDGILLSHQKERIWISFNEVDDSRAYYIEWSKKEKSKYHINTYIWNLEGLYWCAYLQGSNEDASPVAQMVKNRLQCGRPRFYHWVAKIPWRRAWQPPPEFLPEESPWTEEPGGLYPWGHKESDMTDQLSTHSRDTDTENRLVDLNLSDHKFVVNLN